MVKRRVVVGASGEKASAPTLSKVLNRWSQILAHCATLAYEDGCPRQPGWITIRTRGIEWECIAKDPDAGAQLIARGASVDDAMQLLNELLGADNAPWELDQYLSARKPRKRK